MILQDTTIIMKWMIIQKIQKKKLMLLKNLIIMVTQDSLL